MAKADKLLARMRNNPGDWTIGDLQALARRYGVDWRQPGTSHVTFFSATGGRLTVPSHKPIKPIYVEQFVALLERMGVSDGD